jgi:hypothetical protein
MAVPAQTRRKFQVKWWVWALVGLTAVAGLAWATSGTWADRGPRVSAGIWDAPDAPAPEGSALAAAKAFLEALVKGDYEAALSLYASAQTEAAAELERAVKYAGGVKRYRLVTEEVTEPGPEWPSFAGGEARTVWAAIGTRKMGDHSVGITLAHARGESVWRILVIVSTPVYDGLVGPRSYAVGPECLVPLSQRDKPLDSFDDAIFSAIARSDRAEGRRTVSVVVSPKVELFAVLAGLSGAAPEYGAPPLGGQARAWFKDHRDYPAVLAMGRLAQNGFRFDAVAALGLYFSDPPNLEQILPLTDDLVGRSYGIDRVERESRLLELVELARRFAREADFGAYLQAKSQDYDALLQAVKGRLAPGIPAALEDYFGASKDGYVAVVSGLVGKHAYGPRLTDGDWTCVIMIMSPDATTDASAVRTLLLHEWGHSFVKPALESSRELAERYAYLYPPVRTAMEQQNYGNWNGTLAEHVLRAVTARIIRLSDGTETAELMLQREEGRGFKYIRPLYKRLAVYEQNRDRYPTFADFVPELLKALGSPGAGGG